jgi:hypothetical protein
MLSFTYKEREILKTRGTALRPFLRVRYVFYSSRTTS